MMTEDDLESIYHLLLPIMPQCKTVDDVREAFSKCPPHFQKILQDAMEQFRATVNKELKLTIDPEWLKKHADMGEIVSVGGLVSKIRDKWDQNFEDAWQGLKGDHSKISVHIIDEMHENEWITLDVKYAASKGHRGNHLTEKGLAARFIWLSNG